MTLAFTILTALSLLVGRGAAQSVNWNETKAALGQFEQLHQQYEQQHSQEQNESFASIGQDLEQMGEMIEMLKAAIEAIPTSEK